jgi:hypothetical protein
VHKPLSVNMGFGIRQRSTTPLLSAGNCRISAWRSSSIRAC